uniref:Uncharacterized protein n=1 Tax=Picea sitchensis TaxID=3332 RepID=A9NQP6_PICSI|nr:unknown [Picea sitchensis]
MSKRLAETNSPRVLYSELRPPPIKLKVLQKKEEEALVFGMHFHIHQGKFLMEQMGMLQWISTIGTRRMWML